MNINNTDISHTLIGIGCGGADTITSNGGLLNILIGDNGDLYTVLPSSDVIHKLGNVQDNANGLDISNIFSDDILTATTPSDGRTVVIGGIGDDHIFVDSIAGDVTVCGDHCQGNAPPNDVYVSLSIYSPC
jgi:hypothetical protein